MKTIKAVYIGELSGIVIPDLGDIDIKRGRPFDCPEDWLQNRMKVEPLRWRVATQKEVDDEAARVKAAAASAEKE